jgi:hypothetical protein
MPKTSQKTAPVAKVVPAKTEASTQKPMAPAPVQGAAVEPVAVAELTGIKNGDKPVRAEDIWQFVKKNAGNNPVNVELVPLDNAMPDGKASVPFVKLDKPGKRSSIIWAALNGVGKDHDRRLSAFLQEGLRNGMSKTQCADLVALMNGGYSRASKSWGTPFVKLVVKGPSA